MLLSVTYKFICNQACCCSQFEQTCCVFPDTRRSGKLTKIFRSFLTRFQISDIFWSLSENTRNTNVFIVKNPNYFTSIFLIHPIDLFRILKIFLVKIARERFSRHSQECLDWREKKSDMQLRLWPTLTGNSLLTEDDAKVLSPAPTSFLHSGSIRVARWSVVIGAGRRLGISNTSIIYFYINDW